MSKQGKYISIQETAYLDITVPPEMVMEFKQLVRRSINTWPDASPEMRRFVDQLMGQEDIMQSTYDTGRDKIQSNEIQSNEIVQVVPTYCSNCAALAGTKHSSFCIYSE